MESVDVDVEDNTTFPEDEDRITTEYIYKIESCMYLIAIILGSIACVYTIRRFRRCCKENIEVAARLISYKISLSVADALVLFVYAPTQLTWIRMYWWYGGDFLCRTYKFVAAFAFHLTGNMQVLIAFDRLFTMSHLNKIHVKGVTEYNNRLLLTMAWLLALISSLPQLYIFRVEYWESDQPQCVSLWTQYSYAENLVNAYHFERIQSDSNYTDASTPDPLPPYTIEEVEQQRMFMQKLQKIYNVIHLSTMLIVPYALELIFYALILSLLSQAQKGEIVGIKQFLRKRVLHIFCADTPSRDNRKELVSLSTDIELSLPETIQHRNEKESERVKVVRRSSSSENNSPAGTRKNKFKRHRPRLQTIDVGVRRMTMAHPVMANGTHECPLLSPMSIPNENSRLVALRAQQSRRASAPCPSQMNTRRISVPWMKTVIVARKNARKKAFLMLSFNLIFWLPYCFQAIASSVNLIDSVSYLQLSCALVVFNAITNILL